MEREKLIAIGINYDAGMNRFVGKADLYEKYLRQFTTDPHFSNLKEEMDKGEYDKAFRSAHALKGIISTLGMDALFAIVSETVEVLRDKEVELAKEKLQELEAAYGGMVAALREYFGEAGSAQ